MYAITFPFGSAPFHPKHDVSFGLRRFVRFALFIFVPLHAHQVLTAAR